jgi:succinate-acetate transporter protein
MSLPNITYLLPRLDMIVFLLLVYNLNKNHGRSYVQDYFSLLHNFSAIYTCVQPKNESRILFSQIALSQNF